MSVRISNLHIQVISTDKSSTNNLTLEGTSRFFYLLRRASAKTKAFLSFGPKKGPYAFLAHLRKLLVFRSKIRKIQNNSKVPNIPKKRKEKKKSERKESLRSHEVVMQSHKKVLRISWECHNKVVRTFQGRVLRKSWQSH